MKDERGKLKAGTVADSKEPASHTVQQFQVTGRLLARTHHM